MRKNLCISALILLASLVPWHLAATHIVGGEIVYRHLGNNQYNVQLNLFIDCVNGDPGAIASDEQALFYVFRAGDGSLLPGFPMAVNRSVPERLVKLHYNCLANAPNACVDFYAYDTTIALPADTAGYIVSFQRCCRNNSITNLQNPGTQGANYWTHIPDVSQIPDGVQNNSAEFNLLPPNFLCTNALLQFDHSARDEDEDSLAYDLFWPYTGGTSLRPRPDNGANGLPQHPPFSKITWLSAYSDQNPIDGKPPLSIDPKTGKLTLLPTKAGQYVVGIRVKEFRHGQCIAETRRDYQFNVSDCDLTLLAGPGGNQRVCNNHVILTNNSSGAQRFSWDFGVQNLLSDTSNEETPEYDFPAPGIYQVKLRVYKNNCADSAVSEVRIGSTASGVATVDVHGCTEEVWLNAETDAPKVVWLLDGVAIEGKNIKHKVLPGLHHALAVFIDTVADCNDTVASEFDLVANMEDLRLANVFTPDGDGKNDCYRIGGEIGQCSQGVLRIFNRWGERVFITEDLAVCWNGQVDNTGAQLPEGTYFYQLDYGSKESNKYDKTISGAIQLIR